MYCNYFTRFPYVSTYVITLFNNYNSNEINCKKEMNSDNIGWSGSVLNINFKYWDSLKKKKFV